MANESQLHIGKDQYEAIDVQSRVELTSNSNNLLGKLNDWLINNSGVKIKPKVTFFRLLAVMINAGVSLVKSLHILEDQIDDPKLKRICASLAMNVEAGQSLSYGMETFPEVFPESQVGMVKSGEASGKLNSVLLQIADQTESSAKMAGKIKGAMMYPITIIIVLMIVSVAIVVMVVPKLQSMFANANAQLPAATRALIAISSFLTSSLFGIPNWALMFLVVVIAYVGFVFWKKSPSGKYYWDKFILILPVFGELNRKVVLGKFCNSLSTLTKSGISIVKAIKITADVVGNEIYKRRILLIADDVQKGITIAENIKDDKMFPVMVTSMIGVGEQTAQLDNVTAKIADFYNDEVDNMVKNLSSLMEPIVIVLIGGLVGFLVSAIMLPVMKMSEVVAS